MDSATWVAIYLPIFLILFVILPAGQQIHRRVLLKNNRKRGGRIMPNELLKKYIGSRCVVSTGSFGDSVAGVIRTVEENWIEVETNKGLRLVNADYVTKITQTRP